MEEKERMSWLEKLPDALMLGAAVSAAGGAIFHKLLFSSHWYIFGGLILAAGIGMFICVIKSDDAWWYM